MGDKILVTGATGHVGNVLIRKLTSLGHSVRALIFPGEDTLSLSGLDVEKIQGDILNPGDVRKAVHGVEYVYHLASLISIGGISDDVVRRVNVHGTRNVALACREAAVARMVYVSSIHALERPAEGKVIDETLSFDPNNPAGEYDRSKAEASLEVLRLVETGLNAVIVCPTGIIGPYDFRASEMGRMISAWMKKQPHWMVGGHFDFVDVRDVVDGLISACTRGTSGETYIFSGHRLAVAKIRQSVQKAIGIHSPQLMVPGRIALWATKVAYPLQKLCRTAGGFTPYSIETVMGNSDISSKKAEKALGFAKRPFAQTLSDAVEWWRQNRGLAEHPGWYGKVALIAGASGGIGAATAKKLAAKGMQVVLVARNRVRLAGLAEEIRCEGGRAEYFVQDLTSDDASRNFLEFISAKYHGIDVLVNSAGFGWYGYFEEMLEETAVSMVQVNNTSLVRLCLLALDLMKNRGSGRIINIGSIAGEIEAQGVALYSATKAFVNTFTRALSRELRGSRIKACVVRPGAVASEFFAVSKNLAHGRAIPASSHAISPDHVADKVWGVLRRPRVTVYVPGGLRVLRYVRTLFGLVLDAAGPVHLKRHARAESE